jgi:hypothetical protein
VLKSGFRACAHTRPDLKEFGKVPGIKESCVEKILSEFNGKQDGIDNLVSRSLLKDEIKADFKDFCKDKLKRINAM